MTKQEMANRFGIVGTLGNGSELRPAKLREEPVKSYHLIRDGEEVAIRYSLLEGTRAMDSLSDDILIKPIFRQFPPEIRN